DARPAARHQLRAHVYVQTFAAEHGEPILFAGADVAGVRRAVGAGSAWLLGTYVGHSGTAYRDPAAPAAVRAMLAACGVHPEQAGRLIVRKRVLPEKEAWFFANPTGEPVTACVSTAGWSLVEELLGGEIGTADDTVHFTVDPLDMRVLVLRR
ncbi:MAG TPA: hypothetical protein PLZ36_17390, partial [Armatimonadota bacterium]|nr:hypothetical protein [Armatimonadota bacterium]